MTRRCSHCSNNGHNSRTCPNRGVKIFGVRFDGGGSIRKSASMGNLSYYGRVSGGGSPAAAAEGGDEREKDGYASEDFGKGRERKKGVAWTEEEHKMFLRGLHQLGKGDWRGIARKYVVSRTATQVASHAQKYFIRQNHANRRKRRSSLFDMVGDAQSFPVCNEEPETESINPVPAPLPTEAEHESMNSTSSNAVLVHPALDVQPFPSDISRNIPNPETMLYPCAMMYPPCPPFFPFSYPGMLCYKADATATSRTHSVVKPTAVHSTSPINVDELVGMSKLSLGETAGDSRSSSSMPINLRGGSSQRHSAFRTNNPSTSGSGMNLSSSPPIHAM